MSPTVSYLTSVLLVAGQLAHGAAIVYRLEDNYDSTNFFSGFNFFDGADPTHGFVDYLNKTAATSAGLAGYTEGMIYLGVDHTTKNPVGGRASTRVSSRKTYTKGLFLADINHMPVGCGVWPAYWMFGAPWPQEGEIDIIEGVNSQTTNQITLHTSAGCNLTNTGSLASSKITTVEDCNYPSDGTLGCSMKTASPQNYGPGFNAGAGGIYAMEWTDEAISVWFFPRNSTQATALSLSSTNSTGTAMSTANFGTPVAKFSGGDGCDIDSHFIDHAIVLDTTFCGDWAARSDVWPTDATCSKLATTCEAYVAANPSAFIDSYWLINSIKVYQPSNSSVKQDHVRRTGNFLA